MFERERALAVSGGFAQPAHLWGPDAATSACPNRLGRVRYVGTFSWAANVMWGGQARAFAVSAVAIQHAVMLAPSC